MKNIFSIKIELNCIYIRYPARKFCNFDIFRLFLIYALNDKKKKMFTKEFSLPKPNHFACNEKSFLVGTTFFYLINFKKVLSFGDELVKFNGKLMERQTNDNENCKF